MSLPFFTASGSRSDVAIHYDPQSGLAVINAAEVNFRLGNVRDATRLYDQAGHMSIGDEAKRAARKLPRALIAKDPGASEGSYDILGDA